MRQASRARAGAPHPEGGFTLLELLVVLFIMVLLVSQIPPLFSNGATGIRLRSTVVDMADDLRTARATAIRTSLPAGVTFDQASRSYSVTGDPKIRRLAEEIGVTITAVTWHAPGTTQAGIEFLPDGSSSGGDLLVTEGARRFHILIDWLTGRVTIHA